MILRVSLASERAKNESEGICKEAGIAESSIIDWKNNQMNPVSDKRRAVPVERGDMS